MCACSTIICTSISALYAIHKSCCYFVQVFINFAKLQEGVIE